MNVTGKVDDEGKRLYQVDGEPKWLTIDEAVKLDDPEGTVTLDCTLSATLFKQLEE